MNWTQALKEFQIQNGGKFKIPKKGTDDYEKVIEIMKKQSKNNTNSIEQDGHGNAKNIR